MKTSFPVNSLALVCLFALSSVQAADANAGRGGFQYQCMLASDVKLSSTERLRKAVLERRTIRAIALIEARARMNEGLSLLEKAATAGGDEANFRLGWLYMEGAVAPADPKKASTFLRRVKGKFATQAAVLIGVIHARGAEGVPPDRDTAAVIFRAIDECVRREMELIKQRGEPTTVSDMEQRMQFLENSTLLYGFSKELGIELDAPRK